MKRWLLTDKTGRFSSIVVDEQDAEAARDRAFSYLDAPDDPLEDLEFQRSTASHLLDESAADCVELLETETGSGVWIPAP
jgi:hypothetical protein